MARLSYLEATSPTDIEIINNGDSRVIISLDYDPVLHPRGVAKIITLGSASKNNEINE